MGGKLCSAVSLDSKEKAMRFPVRALSVLVMTSLTAGAALAQKGETVKIAWIDPLSGLMASVGQNQLKSYQFVAEKLNAGNPAGVKFEIISIDNINSAGIRAEARKAGISTVTKLGDNGKFGDARVTIYQLGDVRVADTNGDPVWEESDNATFAELLESEGIAL